MCNILRYSYIYICICVYIYIYISNAIMLLALCGKKEPMQRDPSRQPNIARSVLGLTWRFRVLMNPILKGLGFRVWGSGFRVQGLGYSVTKYNCTYNPLIRFSSALLGLELGYKYSYNWFISTINLYVGCGVEAWAVVNVPQECPEQPLPAADVLH